ncbi:MAG: homoserine dehydrogenase [Candidatus Omnitrophica bacterium]|nr:homoserine dehydrogenase [Candidatus Omnitrophota bacterium]
MKTVNVGIIGFGTVGSGVVKALKARRELIRRKSGIDIRIAGICDADLRSKRDVKVDKKLLTKDAYKLIRDPQVDIVVELIGGIHPAKEIILESLNMGKPVVTANKALLAHSGEEIVKAAQKKSTYIRFEASVCGGVPVIKAIRESFVANKMAALFGIVNGTSNYILTQMKEKQVEFKVALKSAQKKGYAERIPSLDVKGIDASHKLAILALLAFGHHVKLSDIYTEGIEGISYRDIQYADGLGYVVKPLAIAKRHGDELEVRVHPTLISKKHLLSNVSGVYNALYLSGDLIGNSLFYGEGAGKLPTSSAVISDIVELAKNLIFGGSGTIVDPEFDIGIKKVRKRGDFYTRYYLHFSAIDKPGVLARVSGILGKHKISIASATQKERKREKVVPIVMTTHWAKESNMAKALKEIDRLPAIKKRTIAIRIEGG